MGAHSDNDEDGLGDGYRPRAADLDVHTVPLPEPPARSDPRDPNALLATLVERSHQSSYEAQEIKATLESIRASVGRLATASQSFAGTDQQLAKRIAQLERDRDELRQHVQALELWQANLIGRGAVYAMMGGLLVAALGALLTKALEHVKFG
jgi:outer membrane murein-binding lipoprotein Lpp